SPVITATDPVSVTMLNVPDVFTGKIDFTGDCGTQSHLSFADGAVLLTAKGFTSETDLTLVTAKVNQTVSGVGVESVTSPNHNLANEIDFRKTDDGQRASEELTIGLAAGKVAY